MDTISNFLCVEKMGWSDAYGIAEYSNMDDYADDAEYLILKQFKWNESAESVVNQILPTIKQIETALNFDKEA